MNNFITFAAVYKDEAKVIRPILNLVHDLFGHIIISVQKSEDSTLKICKEYTKNIIERPIEPPEITRDLIMDQVKTPWVMFLDADEFPSLSLIRRLEMITPADLFGHDAVSLIRINYINGLEIEGGQGIDRQFKILRKDVRWDHRKQGRAVHIHPLCTNPIESDWIIYHHRTLEKVKSRTEDWNAYQPSTKKACDKYVADVIREMEWKK